MVGSPKVGRQIFAEVCGSGEFPQSERLQNLTVTPTSNSYNALF